MQQRYFISDDIREELQKRSETIHTGPAMGLGLPEELQGYHSLVPLENSNGDRRKFGSWTSTVYRAINSKDGLPYVLRRVESPYFPLPLLFPFTPRSTVFIGLSFSFIILILRQTFVSRRKLHSTLSKSGPGFDIPTLCQSERLSPRVRLAVIVSPFFHLNLYPVLAT